MRWTHHVFTFLYETTIKWHNNNNKRGRNTTPYRRLLIASEFFSEKKVPSNRLVVAREMKAFSVWYITDWTLVSRTVNSPTLSVAFNKLPFLCKRAVVVVDFSRGINQHAAFTVALVTSHCIVYRSCNSSCKCHTNTSRSLWSQPKYQKLCFWFLLHIIFSLVLLWHFATLMNWFKWKQQEDKWASTLPRRFFFSAVLSCSFNARERKMWRGNEAQLRVSVLKDVLN